MRHASYETKPSQHSRRSRAAELVRSLIKGETGPAPDAIDRLPFRALEDRDSAGRELQRTHLTNGAKRYLDGNPIVNEAWMRNLFGIDHTQLIGMIKGLPPVGGIVPPRTPEERHIDELNTICILQELTPDGKPSRVVVTNMTMLQKVRQDRARGFAPYIPADQLRVLLPGTPPLQLGRGVNSWLPFRSVRDNQPDDPAYIPYLHNSDKNISHNQAVISFEPDGRVAVADGRGAEGELGSWNGTDAIYGTEVTADDIATEAMHVPDVGSDPWANYDLEHGITQFMLPGDYPTLPHDSLN